MKNFFIKLNGMMHTSIGNLWYTVGILCALVVVTRTTTIVPQHVSEWWFASMIMTMACVVSEEHTLRYLGVKVLQGVAIFFVSLACIVFVPTIFGHSLAWCVAIYAVAYICQIGSHSDAPTIWRSLKVPAVLLVVVLMATGFGGYEKFVENKFSSKPYELVEDIHPIGDDYAVLLNGEWQLFTQEPWLDDVQKGDSIKYYKYRHSKK